VVKRAHSWPSARLRRWRRGGYLFLCSMSGGSRGTPLGAGTTRLHWGHGGSIGGRPCPACLPCPDLTFPSTFPFGCTLLGKGSHRRTAANQKSVRPLPGRPLVSSPAFGPPLQMLAMDEARTACLPGRRLVVCNGTRSAASMPRTAARPRHTPQLRPCRLLIGGRSDTSRLQGPFAPLHHVILR
jgi:hypothetical protein